MIILSYFALSGWFWLKTLVCEDGFRSKLAFSEFGEGHCEGGFGVIGSRYSGNKSNLDLHIVLLLTRIS